MASPATALMDVSQLESTFGVKVKTYILQMERARVGKGICFALTEKWLRTGLIENKEERRTVRKGFRDDITDTLRRGLPPSGIEERQKQLTEDKEKELPKVVKWKEPIDEHDFGLASTKVHSGIGPLQYEVVRCGFQLGDSEAERLAWGTQLANLLISHEDGESKTTSTAYFCLEMRRNANPREGRKAPEQHMVGLKRGKFKTPRHYSLFDPNHFEITQIKEEVLPKFLAYFSSHLPKFDYGYLAQVKLDLFADSAYPLT